MPPGSRPPTDVSRETPQAAPPHPVVLFDGVCNLCNGAVQFLIDRDPTARFRFASLQSGAGQELLAAHGLGDDRPDSIVLVHRGQALVESDAALGIARLMGGPWRVFGAARILPRGVRDWAYRLIARNRYRLFGRTEACRIPTPELRARFLDA